MKTVMLLLVWRGLMMMKMMRRIRMMRRIEPSGPPLILITIPITTTTLPTANVRRRQGGIALPPAPPPDEEALRVDAVTLEQNDVARVKALVLDVAAPPFGEHVALAAVPVRVAEAPTLPRLVLETQ